jgi:hypothetical protein
VEGHYRTVVKDFQFLGTTRLKHLTTAARLAHRTRRCGEVAYSSGIQRPVP